MSLNNSLLIMSLNKNKYIFLPPLIIKTLKNEKTKFYLP